MASVTESAATRRCRWCGREFPITPGPGRPKLFCKAACRQADYLARQRSADTGISEAEHSVTREALDVLSDTLYVTEAALEDRYEARWVGTECVQTGITQWSALSSNKNAHIDNNMRLG